jgi:hypothetical protein
MKMNKKPLIEAGPVEAHQFTEAFPAMPAWVPLVQQTPDELPATALVPRTFRLPQRLSEDLAGAGELSAFAWLDREGNIWLPSS